MGALFVIVGFAALGAAAAWVLMRRRKRLSPPSALVARILAAVDYGDRVFIGMPLEAPAAWRRVLSGDVGTLALEGGEKVPTASVSAFITADASGDVSDSERVFAPLPENFKMPP